MDELRVTRQIAPDHWITYCRACPQREGKRHGPTEQAVDMWWAKHVQTELHKRRLKDDGRASREETLLSAIFGKDAPTRRDKRNLAGEKIIRDGRTRLRRRDNPKG